MKIKKEELSQVAENMSMELIGKFIDNLNLAMIEFEINTYPRIAMFLGQILHESGEFRYMEEIWGPTKTQAGYDKRSDLGNTNENAIRIATLHGSTPGRWWSGHGPIQVTGYTNHMVCGNALGLDLLNNPRLITLPKDGCRSAAWYWKSRHLNEISDSDDETAFKRATILINGGMNGYEERKRYWITCQEALGA